MAFIVRMNDKSLGKAYDAVRSGDPNAEWALYTVKDNSTDLIVEATGTGGLEELCSRFSDSRCAQQFSEIIAGS